MKPHVASASPFDGGYRGKGQIRVGHFNPHLEQIEADRDVDVSLVTSSGIASSRLDSIGEELHCGLR